MELNDGQQHAFVRLPARYSACPHDSDCQHSRWQRNQSYQFNGCSTLNIPSQLELLEPTGFSFSSKWSVHVLPFILNWYNLRRQRPSFSVLNDDAQNRANMSYIGFLCWRLMVEKSRPCIGSLASSPTDRIWWTVPLWQGRAMHIVTGRLIGTRTGWFTEDSVGIKTEESVTRPSKTKWINSRIYRYVHKRTWWSPGQLQHCQSSCLPWYEPTHQMELHKKFPWCTKPTRPLPKAFISNTCCPAFGSDSGTKPRFLSHQIWPERRLANDDFKYSCGWHFQKEVRVGGRIVALEEI